MSTVFGVLDHRRLSPDIARLREEFVSFTNYNSQKFSSFESDAIAEAQRRLWQMGILSGRIDLVDTQRLMSLEGLGEMELDVECFYYIAFRCCSVLKRLPVFSSLSFRGISNARNNLVEHPDNKAGIFSHSMTWSAGKGVVLKSSRQERDNKELLDKGLYYNYDQFAASLRKIMNNPDSGAKATV